MRIRLVSLVLLAGLAVSSFADGRLGERLRGEGGSHTLAEWRALAESGDRGAEATLGRLYFEGQEVEPDFRQAITWLRKAAEQGEPSAELYLGMAYRDGLGVSRSDSEAAIWWRRAAEMGNAEAQYRLGYLLDRGLLISPGDPLWPKEPAAVDAFGRTRVHDYAEAARWYKAAAVAGNAGAMLNLGTLYRDGRGVPKDAVQAVRLFQAAAAEPATPHEPAPSLAAINLAREYQEGEVLPRDDAEAARWMRKAAESGALPPFMEMVAAGTLADLYTRGAGVPQDNAEAAQWRQRMESLRHRVWRAEPAR